ncbi:RagB/SusD family nutrient uptake outer membrane protein [Muricauda oceani]|uniref:RagB/SusD family nutrient uptake outer membrane protein n=1 Tax=Flagellimonas oceani TaxID=2698672 RepID=A0A6G7J5I2_9FLAO|nr:RagB/SusD family nutrient uptake outer membrane protein [Allomuricauda oceani]MBW8243530.1 RagB/SusD family nutrient uptake outer membrane protein [Allomuricauda oceani]QII45742.1 RagB/SusD family nutrient uptake outer membrane protein [Allomuricauda oceani]
MKKLKIKMMFTAMLAVTLFIGSCTEDILEEEPRSVFTPDFFQTETGVEGGVTSLYVHLRFLYGAWNYYNSTETGTDEYTWAQSADGNFRDMDLSGVGSIISTSAPPAGPWFSCFEAINTASGIIENAESVGIDESLVSEARFFRAFDYFLLVQTYGGVPLDLGAGELKFNTSTNRGSVRNTVPEVYTKAIFPDLLTAIENLPEFPRLTGTVTKNVARLYLSKAYLTYAWWLENPNNIPTYPEAPRTDPDGRDAAWYYQQAYNIAATAIDNPGPYGLLDYFYDVHWAPNDRHNEMMLYADHTQESAIYNGADLNWGISGAQDNASVWMATWNYTVIRSSGASTVQREAAQSYGRPWTRMAPPVDVFEETFEEKDLDSRYDGTFVTSYRGNWDKGGDATESYPNANGLPVEPGDAILTFLDENNPNVVYPDGQGESNVGAGVLPGRADFVIEPGAISRIVYPGLWKLGTYRTDNSGGLGAPNAGLTRPFPIAKFSEFYFIAAEAAVQGAVPQGGKTARDLINVIRARAGRWRFDNGEQMERIEDNSAALTAETPAVIDIDYILAERSREYFGEGYRWYDLVRTQKWEEIAGSYRIAGPNYGDHTPETFNRTIEDYHYLRPIPQGQLDAMEATEAEKSAYQNPGY